MLKKRPKGQNARGFSLLEVMVALVVISVGLLGILKLEAAAVASTTVAAKRSLAAIEAPSLAASMHANRGYWTSFDASNAVINFNNTVITTLTGAPNLLASIAAAPNCATPATPCSVTDMAAYDLIDWATNGMRPLLRNFTAQIACSIVTPVTCNININWTESAVATNAQEAAAAQTAAFQKPSYTLYVEP
jgi:type IV pilus assembly protein PilV